MSRLIPILNEWQKLSEKDVHVPTKEERIKERSFSMISCSYSSSSLFSLQLPHATTTRVKGDVFAESEASMT